MLALLSACGPDAAKNKECDVAAVGAGCSQDGQVCDGGADLCIEHTALACKDGRWQEQGVAPLECDTGTGTGTGTTMPTTTTTMPTTTATTTASTGGPIACDPEDVPAEGSACETEGEYCSPGCEDPCQFCNVVRCEDGTWQGQEVFPVDCLSCDGLCPLVLAAGCSAGPVDQADCLAGCEFSSAGDCQTSYHQSLACAGSQPTFSCDAMGRPIVAGCEPQFDTFYMCAGL